MHKAISLAAAVLVTLAILPRTIGHAQNAPTVETLATLPSPGPSMGNTENIAQGPDGSLYVTALLDRILWKISPDGKVSQFFTSPSHAAFVGVAAGKDEIVVGVFLRPFQPSRADVGSQMLVLDKSGALKATLDAPQGTFLNGLARAADGWYLATDTNGHTLYSISVADRTLQPWLDDDSANRANGIKVHNGWVYYSNGSGQATVGDKVYRVQIGNRKPKGKPEVFAEGVKIDDFGIAPDGSIYVPTGTTVMKVSPRGEVSKFLDNVPNGPGAWVTNDGKWLYWPQRAGPSKVLRVALK